MFKLPSQFYPNINTRITLPFLVVIALVAGFGVFTVIRLVAGSTQERLVNQLVESARSAQATVVETERETLEILRFSVFTDGLAEAIAVERTVELDVLIRPIAINAALDDVILFDADGQNIYQLRRAIGTSGETYNPPEPLTDVTSWTITQRILGGEADLLGDKWVDIQEAPDGTMFYIGAPVTNDENEVVGGMLVGFLGFNLSRQVSLQALSFVTLYDLDGNPLGSTLRTEEDISLTSEAVEDILAQSERSTPLDVFQLGETSYQRLYVPFEMRSQPLGLIAVSLQNNFVTERSTASRNIFAGIFAVMFVAVLGIGLVVARSITSPVNRLVATTRAIREGDLSRRVGLKIPDELGELSNSFDHMTTQLIQRNDEINELFMAQLRENAQREAVLTSIRDVLVVMAPDGKAIMQNPAAETLIRDLRRYHDPSEYQRFIGLCLRPERLEQPRNISLMHRFFSTLATPVVSQEYDAIIGYVIVFRDITDLVEAERVKDELTLQLSHELKTPLTAIAGYIGLQIAQQEAAANGNGNGNNNSYAARALEQVDVLSKMIEQVIEVSTIITDKLTLDYELFDIVDLLRETIAEIRPNAQHRQQRVSLSVQKRSFYMWADRERIRRVFYHLLQNAHHYTLSGGVFAVSLDIHEDDVSIVVVDNGVGIKEEELERVFDRLYRGESASAGPTDARGLGLGLYLSRAFVEAHGGSLTLSSEIGVGTTATVKLPIRQPTLEAEAIEG